MKHNPHLSFVLSPEEHNRVVALFSLLVMIEKRMNGKSEKPKKAKTVIKNRSFDEGSRCGPSFIGTVSFKFLFRTSYYFVPYELQ